MELVGGGAQATRERFPRVIPPRRRDGDQLVYETTLIVRHRNDETTNRASMHAPRARDNADAPRFVLEPLKKGTITLFRQGPAWMSHPGGV